jgi:MFS transporter, DHA1 family, multidrug resistance protein
MSNEKQNGLRAPVYASLALSFALLGDAFLYPFLPVNFAEAGISMNAVGLILSANRFVRILMNSVIIRLFGIFGLRTLTIAAVVTAVLSTAGYAIAAGIYWWLFFRVCWGLAFSVLRISSISYALQNSRQGFALGFSKSIQEAGPLFCLLIAPVLLYYFKPVTIFLLLALLSTPSIYFACKLPLVYDKIQTPARSIFASIPSAFNLITLLSSFLIDGLVVVVLGLLFLRYGGEMTLIKAASLAAFYLGYKRICFVVISPFGGMAADRFGIHTIFNVCLVMVIVGMTILVSGWIVTGVITLFTFYTMMSALTPGSASQRHVHALSAVAENATWRDVGAALGALVGGILLSFNYLMQFLQAGIFILAILAALNLFGTRLGRKMFYTWK